MNFAARRAQLSPAVRELFDKEFVALVGDDFGEVHEDELDEYDGQIEQAFEYAYLPAAERAAIDLRRAERRAERELRREVRPLELGLKKLMRKASRQLKPVLQALQVHPYDGPNSADRRLARARRRATEDKATRAARVAARTADLAAKRQARLKR